MTVVADDIALNQTYAHAVARWLVRPLLGTWVRPNHLTVLRIGIGLTSCALLATGMATYEFWSGILWIVACMLDRADGELARIGNLRSELGKTLDFYSDLLLDAAWFLAAGCALGSHTLHGQAIPLGVFTAVSMGVAIGMSELYERQSIPGVKAFYGLARFHPDDALFLMPLFVWSHTLAPVLVAASVFTPILAVVVTLRYFAARKRTRSAARK
jgi:archaetidylinositol phosphate synthase